MNPLALILDFIFPPRESQRLARRANADTIATLICPTIEAVTLPATVSLLPFRDASVRALIHEAKYYANDAAQEILGRAVRDYLIELGAESYGPLVLVPLPLSGRRMKERGFNQCERILRYATDIRGVVAFPLDTSLLERIKDTEHQTLLSGAKRRENMRNAFDARGSCDSSATYVLFDDVITTGATMQAAIDALMDAGAQHVIPLALAC